MHEILDGHRHRSIHHLQTSRNDAGGDHRRHRLARATHIVKTGHDAARQLGFGHQAHRHLGRHRQHAFATDHRGEQVVTGRVQGIGAKLDRLAPDGEAAHFEHVVDRQAVLEAMHPTRVLRHIAAYGASDLARRVGGVIQTQVSRRLTDGEVAHATLHDRRAGVGVDRDDAIELGH